MIYKKIINYFLPKYYRFFKKNLYIGNNFKVNGRPMIYIGDACRIEIGDNVLLNSSNAKYHVNMFAPVKLLCDRNNAKIIIGNNTRIHGTCIHAYNEVVIGENCLIAANTQIFDGNGHNLSMDNPANRIHTTGKSKPIRIEDNVWIGTNCIVLPGTTIGSGSVISAGSVVDCDIPPGCLAGGNPVKIIKTYN